MKHASLIGGLMALTAMAATPVLANERTFGGHRCLDTCAGHKAGYEWAELNAVTDESECEGNSPSFIEGCEIYVEDPLRGADLDDDGELITDR